MSSASPAGKGIARDMVDWKKIRNDFPVTREKIYFISAGLSPVPSPVLGRIEAEYERLNASGDIHWERDIESYRALMTRVGWRIGAAGDDLAIVMNTSTAMSLVAMSIKDERGGDFNVVSMMDEFPSSTVPFEYQGVDMRYVEPREARYPVESVLERVDGGTLAVVTSFVQYATGFRQDLMSLGRKLRERGVLFVVNATQGFPFFPIDVKAMCIDAMSASLHKWGFVGHAGAIFYTSAAFRERFRAPMAGWLSVDTSAGDFIHTAKGKPFKLLGSASRYVMGCLNFQAINPLATALDYLEALGFESIQERIFSLSDRLIDGLRARDIDIVSPVAFPEERSAIVSFRFGERTHDCLPYLAKRNIYVSYRGGNLRVSVNIFNDEVEVDALLDAVDAFRKGGG